MPLKPGSTLKVGDYLATHDYIQSANRCFFAIMQDDGNFVVYRGWDPDHRGEDLWATHTEGKRGGKFFAILEDNANFALYHGTGPRDKGMKIWEHDKPNKPTGRNYYAILQDDGNFVVYGGTPQKRGAVVWATNAYDTLVGSLLDNSSVKYHLDQAKILSDGELVLCEEENKNDTDDRQEPSFTKSESVTEEFGWSHSAGGSIEVSAGVQNTIPCVAAGGFSVTVTGNYQYTWSGSNSRTATWEFTMPVAAAPHTTVVGTALVKNTKIEVPYSATATFTLNSGQKLRVPIEGKYTGANSHSLKFKFQQVGPDGKPLLKAKPVIKQIENVTPVYSGGGGRSGGGRRRRSQKSR